MFHCSGESIMSKAAFIRARIEPELKVMAENILDKLGISPTQAITMLYKRITQEQKWPISLKVPNAKTHRILKETDKSIGLKSAKNIEDLFDKLKI
jgi:DNA-damage-inducible protein J